MPTARQPHPATHEPQGTETIIGLNALLRHLEAAHPSPAVIYGLDADDTTHVDATRLPPGSVLIGNQFGHTFSDQVAAAGSAVLATADVAYNPARASLYTADELFHGFDPDHPATYQNTPDATIYRHWCTTGEADPPPAEALNRRIHDHQITVHMRRWLQGRHVVAIMGGHRILRGTDDYRHVTQLGQGLAQRNFTVATGGGPGAMEAAHLGAALAHADHDTTQHIHRHLAQAPLYSDPEWLAAAWTVRPQLAQLPPPEPGTGIGVPTWAYGHEPPNPFPEVIAKYFENSIREDGLLAMAERGVIFTPGSAGTVQEIFQDATQNHYGTVHNMSSPMVLFGRDYWETTLPVHQLLTALAAGQPYARLIAVVDTVADALDFIDANPPQPTHPT